jgi:Tol biopolymer transport system component
MLAAGTRLGPYEIVAPLGAGGMGEVYEARDSRLDRTVAIKILPSSLSGVPELRARFEREARVISQLNHPHICALYDVGQDNGTDYLVLEYLQGQTLAEEIAKGPLSIQKALTIALEIGDALDRAHRAGIVHRDLKPGNVVLTRTGAKLLDFGLAKSSVRVLPTTPTLTMTTPLTASGSILGTFQYMSPEQIEGGEADARSDLWAFGCTLYEMLTGKPAFHGKTQASLIGAILKDDPPPISGIIGPRATTPVPTSTTAGSTTQPGDGLPRALDRLVRRCLAKAPEDRWQTASDLVEALRWTADGLLPVRAELGMSRPRLGAERLAWAGALILALAVIAWVLWPRSSAPPPQLATFALTLPVGDTFNTAAGVAIAPDGSSVVYGARRNGIAMLYRRGLDQVEAVAIRGTENGEVPFFSPDGRWLGFFVQDALKKVPIEGGPATTICPASYRRGASWTRHGTIVFATRASPDLMQVRDTGGTPQVIVRASDFGDLQLTWPHVSTDDDTVFFTVQSREVSTGRIAAHSLRTGVSQVLTDGTNPVQADGHLLFARDNSLWSVLVDATGVAAAGAPTPRLEDLRVNTGGLALFAVSENGSLVFVPGTTTSSRIVVDVSRAGANPPQANGRHGYPFRAASLSPDGTRLAAEIGEGAGTDIWIYEIERDDLTRLTFDGGRFPLWTPKGDRIVFTSGQDSNRAICWIRADGSGGQEQLTQSSRLARARAFSPDGTVLLFEDFDEKGNDDIWMLPLAGDRTPQLLAGNPGFSESAPAFSPDGQRLAFVSNETGVYEVYVRPFRGTGVKKKASSNGGRLPVWRGNEEILYIKGPPGVRPSEAAGTVMAVPVRTSPALEIGSAVQLFSVPERIQLLMHSLSKDGNRFIGLQTPEGADPRLMLTLNWIEGLKGR